jgi:hypothetical protein
VPGKGRPTLNFASAGRLLHHDSVEVRYQISQWNSEK